MTRSEPVVPRKARRKPFEAVTPEIEAWRKTNPLRLWIDSKPHGFVTELAQKLGLMSRKTIYAWLAGKSLPPADTLLRVCDMAKVGFREYIRWWEAHPGTGGTN